MFTQLDRRGRVVTHFDAQRRCAIGQLVPWLVRLQLRAPHPQGLAWTADGGRTRRHHRPAHPVAPRIQRTPVFIELDADTLAALGRIWPGPGEARQAYAW